MNNLIFSLAIIFLTNFVISPIVIAAPTVEKNIPYKNDTQHTDGILSKVIIVFLVISALAYLAVFLIKRFYFGIPIQTKSNNKLELLEAKRISAKLTLFRVKANNKEICLAQNDNNLLILDSKELNSSTDDDIKTNNL